MMRVLLLFLFCLPLCVVAQTMSSYEIEVQDYRDSIDRIFADSATSILLAEDLQDFYGLHYYNIDESYRVRAKFRKLIFKKKFLMVTSTDRMPQYRRYGVLKFKLGNSKHKLTLYQNLDYVQKHPEYDGLFCPFIDSSKHLQSYGGGRYLDFHLKDLSKSVWIDFNRSYNPYCAYNYRYSCPIPPKENHLKVSIPAGIQRWH